MPLYSFICDEENAGCGHGFERKYSMKQIEDAKVKCPKCGKVKPVYQSFDNRYVVGAPVTLGSLADKNANTLSNDHKSHLNHEHNKYKDRSKNPRPEGWGHYKRDEQGKIIPRGN
jgi:putative FmdB family regulatory protein